MHETSWRSVIHGKCRNNTARKNSFITSQAGQYVFIYTRQSEFESAFGGLSGVSLEPWCQIVKVFYMVKRRY